MTRWLLAGIVCLAPIASQGAQKTDVMRSRHNLSVTGNPVSSSEQDACYFCHTPHTSDVNTTPLWNHKLPVQTYTAYTSTTESAAPGSMVAGSSKACLSCHDGTIALGQTVSAGLIPTTGALRPASVLGADLSNDHPAGIRPVDNGQLAGNLFSAAPTSRDPAVKLPGGRIECTSCHDPHTENIDTVAGKFLVRSNSGGALCLACHDPTRAQPNTLSGWSASAHAVSSNSVAAAASLGPYGSVAANACGNCHKQHGTGAAAAPRLLRAAEEADCSVCHGGQNVSPPLPNLMAEFSKAFSHPVNLVSGQHDPAENVAPVNSARHAECADCHNPHAASGTGGSTAAPGIKAAQLGVKGYNGSAALVPAANEYQVCFKCHADSRNKPQSTAGYSAYGRTAVRETNAQVTDPYNLRLKFASPISRHNVTGARVRTSAQVPSLRTTMLTLNGAPGRALTAGTSIYCTDCHNNDQARDSSGAGPNGPHGSSNTHLLERRYDQEMPPSAGVSYVAGTAGTAALCNKCHDVDNSILKNQSFKLHATHIQGARASCSTCHDPHGIQGGNPAYNYALINFDTSLVSASTSMKILRYEGSGVGAFKGRCYLSCHGVDHGPKSY